MAGMLKSGKRLVAIPDVDVAVGDLIGSGGQGEVYRVNCEGRDMALKWYYPSAATQEQREIIRSLVAMGLDDKRFLWPKALVLGDGWSEGFGYLMDLRTPNFSGLPALFRRDIQAPLSVLIAAGIQLVEAYRTLHSRGVAYRDISAGNVFFDPTSGDVLVCDNDNAVFEGKDTRIGGTPDFMAPELVREEAAPRTQTDLHSLAVLLFMILMNHHPLEGEAEYRIHCLDPSAKRRLHGTSPVFIFDPSDDTNRPVPGEHDTVLATWSIYPKSVKRLFTQAFTVGLHDPDNGRVRESQWRHVLSCVRDSIVYCPSCRRQNFVDQEVYQETGEPGVCWSCQKSLVLPPHIKIGDRLVMLNHDAKLHPHHLDSGLQHDFGQVIAEMSSHPAKPGVFGLKNRSSMAWTTTRPGGDMVQIEPGRTVQLREGLAIRMGAVETEVRAG